MDANPQAMYHAQERYYVLRKRFDAWVEESAAKGPE
jgi:hypothetical protein